MARTGVGHSLVAERTVVPGMAVRNSTWRAAGGLSVFAAALLVAGCGGGKSDATPGNPSDNASVCAYTKRVASGGRVWLQMAVTPAALEPDPCDVFNSRFHGQWIPQEAGRIGTGQVYCGYRKSGSSSTITFGFYASNRATGLAFCRSFHPANGFKRDVSASR
jgi:hypothetical protein